MRGPDGADPRQVLAVTWSGYEAPTRLAEALRAMGQRTTVAMSGRGVRVVLGGGGDAVPTDRTGGALIRLTRGARVGDRDVTDEDVRIWLSADGRHRGLDEVLPPFAAIRVEEDGRVVRAAVDHLGMRSLYSARGEGWAAISTSTTVLAVLAGVEVDRESLAAYSMVGWRLGERTHFRGVGKIPAGTSVSLRDGRLQTWSRVLEAQAGVAPDAALRDAAEVLRTVVRGTLRDHPDAVLQLTGGLDSRLLLAAVPTADRASLAAMTLRIPGSADADLAAQLAERHAMPHHLVDVPTAEVVTPRQARNLVATGARRVDLASDPLAWASLSLVEADFPQVPRLSGLGGEVVRGFYYVGRPTRSSTSPRRIARLARWRLFPNEGVPDEVLAPEFAQWRREAVLGQLEDVFGGLPAAWADATDAFYLYQRMQRWAGATTTSTCQQRLVVNPMLDPRFLAIGLGVPPRDRAGMRFLSGILSVLDPALAGLPLDGRPAPQVYATPGPVNRARLASLTVRKAVGKVQQRARHATRPAAGGATLADRVVEHWRSDDSDLVLAAKTGVVREQTLESIVSGQTSPAPSTVGFLVTLSAGQELLG